MLWTLALIFFVLWLAGLLFFKAAGALIHLLLVIAVIFILYRLLRGSAGKP